MSNAIGKDALEFIDTLLTSEEIAESNIRVADIGKGLAIEEDRIAGRNECTPLYRQWK